MTQRPKHRAAIALWISLVAAGCAATTRDPAGERGAGDGGVAMAGGGADGSPGGNGPLTDGATRDLSPPDEVEATIAADASGDGRASSPARLTLASTGFPTVNGELVFPPSAVFPANESPPFSWTGAPDGVKSFALVFRDLGINAIKWIIWDIPASATMLPRHVSDAPSPADVAGATQRGSLGRTGYSGPQIANERYDFTLWALDVAHLPGTDGKTTAEIFDALLPAHALETSAPLVVKNL